jgi:alpha-beta hydrolase superfamily lysophospholipase
MRYAQQQANLDRIPKELPILVVSGQNDPVGEFGKGPETVAEIYRKTGIQDVTLKLFPDDRHEILNELDREAVDQFLLQWIEDHM